MSEREETSESPETEGLDTRINFKLPVSLRNDLDRIAKMQGRSGIADLLRQLGSEYVLWIKNGGSRPAWTQQRTNDRPSKSET